ncbi:MAG TPA: DNA-binding transcriptional regulator, partial [Syntrophales bacterium]|nr:DNA-binding transcriptional regulator [Syntrophales bacterium]
IVILETPIFFGRTLLLGISKYARLHGPWVFYRESDIMASSIPELRDWHADGIIMRDIKISEQLLGLNLPTVLVPHNYENFPGIPVVRTDGQSIAKMAAEHLLERGLRNFGYCGFNDMSWSLERRDHFKRFISDKNYSVSTFLQPGRFSKRRWSTEQVMMTDWLKGLPKPVGVMACNDDRAQYVIEACKIAELRVPEDVAVIGVDNDDLICDLCDPPLSSVAMDIEKAGYEAAGLLDSMMKGNRGIGKTISIEPTYVQTRYSTDIVATEDKELAKAINFIRDNFRKNIHVHDVVKATALSRRSLELRFRRSLDRSIISEIRRIRVEYISKLLVETELPISEIAYGLGFSSVEHISRYFQRETGKSLRAFRTSTTRA